MYRSHVRVLYFASLPEFHHSMIFVDRLFFPGGFRFHTRYLYHFKLHFYSFNNCLFRVSKFVEYARFLFFSMQTFRFMVVHSCSIFSFLLRSIVRFLSHKLLLNHHCTSSSFFVSLFIR